MNIDITKELLQKYFEGQCTDEETQAVEKYLEGGDTSLFDACISDNINGSQRVDPEVEQVFRQERKKIFRLLTPVVSTTMVRWLAAASILVAALVGGLFIWRSGAGANPKVQFAGGGWVKVSNNEAISIRKIRLPDGTTIYLNAHASVRYDRDSFNVRRRELTLSGEAYFQVAHNADKPFIIHAGNSITTVKGTSFNIDAYDGADEINVTLVEGKVNIQADEWTFDMKPNQRVTIDRSRHNTVKEVDAHEYNKWIRNGELVFDHMALEKAARKLEAIYGVTIQVGASVRQNEYYVKGTFAREPIEKVLNRLLFIHALKYKKQGGKYIITP